MNYWLCLYKYFYNIRNESNKFKWKYWVWGYFFE